MQKREEDSTSKDPGVAALSTWNLPLNQELRLSTPTIPIRAMALAMVLSLGAAAQSVQAQRIMGTVTEAQTGQPLPSAFVVLLDAESNKVRESTTDAEGHFGLIAPGDGAYRLQVSRIGYDTFTTDTLHAQTNELITVALRMGIAPVDLPRLTIVNRNRDVLNDLSHDALYARRSLDRQVGSNRVFVKDDPEFRNAIRVSDLLRYVKPRSQEFSRRTQTWSTCLPMVLWNGFLVTRREAVLAILDGSARDLEGLESYRDYASMPLAVRTEIETGNIDYRIMVEMGLPTIPRHIRECGVLVLWSRRPDYPRK